MFKNEPLSVAAHFVLHFHNGVFCLSTWSMTPVAMHIEISQTWHGGT